MQEVAWPERGYYLVEVQPGANPKHQAELIAPPRRPFYRLSLQVDGLIEPNAIYDAVRKLIRRKEKHISRHPAAVVEFVLSGMLPFNRYDLDLDEIKTIIKDVLSPLLVRVQNNTMPPEFEILVDHDTTSRPELERAIVRELLERDARYRAAADDWAGAALDLKQMVTDKNSPQAILDYLRRARAELVTAEGS